MSVRAWVRIALVGAVAAGLAACSERAPAEAPRRRADCRPPAEVAPLGMEAARAAHRAAERRHDLRLREAADPGFFLRTMNAELDPARLAAGALCPSEVAELGALVFEHEYGFADGLGAGDAARGAHGPFRRVQRGPFGGPETIGCPSCHWVGGANGAGAETDNVFLLGDGERPDSADERNPPALVALGVVQAVAREMTADLQRQRDALLHAGGGARATRLASKGVDFGTLAVGADGRLDARGLRGVDADLVVKPFGWKGTQPDLAAFATDALQIHMGIQNAALLATGTAEVYGTGDAPDDRDADGVRRELGPGPFAALLVHLAVLELPVIEPLVQSRRMPPAARQLLAPTTTNFAEDFQRGRRTFHALGCAECHRPMLVLERPVVEVPGVPPIDLARDMRRPGVTYDASVGGYPVWLFSDLKRHDMGSENAARHAQQGVAPAEYLTPRLWGVADSGPYLHDGRAPSFDYAIAGHGGEGAAARAAFAALSREQKGELDVYLMSLRRPPRLLVP